MFTIPRVIVALLILVGPFLFLALFVWVLWNRYLNHKEALVLLEKTGEEMMGGAWYALLEMRERWRIRLGILAGVVMMALGVAMMLSPFILRSLTGETSSAQSQVAIAIMPGAFIGGFVTIVGVILTVAHAIWARGLRTKPGGHESEQHV